MRHQIKLGAYGWRHRHWATTFYPEDLPADADEDWRLSYYSNQFNTVIVPYSYWLADDAIDCETWRDDVHDGFSFIVECHPQMFERISATEFTRCLTKLRARLSALVLFENTPLEPELVQLIDSLMHSLGVDVFSAYEIFDAALQEKVHAIWMPGKPQKSTLAYIENDLSDLRLAGAIAETFVASLVVRDDAGETDTRQVSMIVDHPRLQAEDLLRFRSVLDIAGY